MSFAFKFLPEEDENADQQSPSKSITSDSSSTEAQSFCWLQDLDAKFQSIIDSVPPHDRIPLNEGPTSTSRGSLARIHDSSTSSRYQGTDLVPGEYEGGGVVWECSIDLCRYLHAEQVVIRGNVLELGCGHGLPGCLVLQQACKRADSSTSVVFSDFNEFVLASTLSNIVLNTRTSENAVIRTGKQLSVWLAHQVCLGAGDWNAMSERLMAGSKISALPHGVPSDGKFDCILAAETTYSIEAAVETARFLTKHLKPHTGIAYIATKRYYFGVGGGSDAFREGLRLNSLHADQFHVDTVRVYDNGAGNIRELLRVKFKND